MAKGSELRASSSDRLVSEATSLAFAAKLIAGFCLDHKFCLYLHFSSWCHLARQNQHLGLAFAFGECSLLPPVVFFGTESKCWNLHLSPKEHTPDFKNLLQYGLPLTRAMFSLATNIDWDSPGALSLHSRYTQQAKQRISGLFPPAYRRYRDGFLELQRKLCNG